MFQSKAIRASHVITLPWPRALCLPLFTPLGERLWVEGWDPRFPMGDHRPPEAGQVFVTGSPQDPQGETTWIVALYDPERAEARYSLMTPGLRRGLVTVTCVAPSETETKVTVRYDLTGLSESGNALVAGLEGSGLVEMVEDWRAHLLPLTPDQIAQAAAWAA